MREFVYFSSTAPTSGKYIKEDLMQSGRLDIAIHSLISSFFLSHTIREDVKLHLIFAGPPDPQKHLEIKPVINGETGGDKIYLNKKDIAKIIKKMLYKYIPGIKKEVFPGYWIENKSLIQVLKELSAEGKEIYFLDEKGEDIRSINLSRSPVLVIGDHHGFPSLKKELKRISHKKISIGPKTYFASHTIAIVNNELDRREI